MSFNFSLGSWTNKGGGYEVPYSGSIQFGPSQKDVDFIVNKTHYSETEAILALLESDYDLQKAIKYLDQQK